MNRQQLASAIKGQNPDIPVIMITGFGAMLLPEGGQPEDVDLLLSKPVSAGDLSRVIARTMKGRKLVGNGAGAPTQDSVSVVAAKGRRRS